MVADATTAAVVHTKSLCIAAGDACCNPVSSPSVPCGTAAPLPQDGADQLSFSFRKLRFLYDTDEELFKKAKYPTKLTFAQYRASGGYGTDAKAAAAAERWGANAFEVRSHEVS